MRVRLDEGILHGFVGLGRVTEVVPCDARRAPLLSRDDLREQVPRRVVVAARQEVLNLRGENGFGFDWARRSLTGERISPSTPSTGAWSAEPPAAI